MEHRSHPQTTTARVCSLPDCGEPIEPGARAVILGEGAAYHRRCFKLICEQPTVVTPCERRAGRFWPRVTAALTA